MNSPTNSASQDAHAHDPHREDLREADSARLTARRAEVFAALARRAARGQPFSRRREQTQPYECDGLTAFRALPMIVVLPTTEEQLAATLRTCHRLRVPVVARGAGTGLSGGALPHRCGSHRVAREVQQDPHARSAVLYRRGSVRRAQLARSARRLLRSAFITRPIRAVRSPAPSAATSPRIPAACIA